MFFWTVPLNRGRVHPRRGRGSHLISCPAVPVGDKVYSFGGHSYMNNRDLIDVQVLDTVTLHWTKLPPAATESGERPLEVPSMRQGHTAVLMEHTVYIWGGFNIYEKERCDTLHTFDVDTHGWFKPTISGTVPKARSHHSACVSGKAMYVHGGHTKGVRHAGDTNKLDTDTMVWSVLITRGPPSYVSTQFHSAHIIGTKMFLFGGQENGDDNKIRVFDTETNVWLSTPPAKVRPKGHGDHAAFAYNGELYIFGGGPFNEEMWKLNAETLSWTKVETKGKCWRPMYSMCHCMVGDLVVLFGYAPTSAYGYVKPILQLLHLSPSLKTLCKQAFIRHGLEAA